MSPEIYEIFARVLREAAPRRSVLEVGAAAGEWNLLAMDCLQGVPEKIGLHLEGPARGEGWEIRQGGAAAMAQFEEGRFDAVISNSTLEHDPAFWKTLAEIRRVTAPGGLVVLGVPGFSGMGVRDLAPGRPWLRRLLRLGSALPGGGALRAGALTLGEHFFPGDYYRFTEQALREVLLEGLTGIQVVKAMNPPRFVGWGRKP